ncbi:MAG: class I SAM-dependent methyltransferase [Flavobacteriales bacterium]|nr:class I SAM-dependent methyltransferase [Flavobacteriales bacterium]
MLAGPTTNQPFSLNDIFQWEVRTWSRAYPMWSKALGSVVGGERRALALGERDGGLSLLLAQHGFTTLCSDLGGPTDAARELHERHGVESLVSYASIDALAINQSDCTFDVVAFKSMIGALGSKEKQARALHEMHRVLKPGGILLFAENLQGSAVHQTLRKRYVRWSSYWRYLDARSDMDLFSDFTNVVARTTGLLASLGRSQSQRDLLARVDGLLAPFILKGWRTVVFGVAMK